MSRREACVLREVGLVSAACVLRAFGAMCADFRELCVVGFVREVCVWREACVLRAVGERCETCTRCAV